MLKQAAGRTCGLVERGPHAGAGLLVGLVTPGDPRWSSLFLRDCTTWRGLALEQLVKNSSLWLQ